MRYITATISVIAIAASLVGGCDSRQGADTQPAREDAQGPAVSRFPFAAPVFDVLIDDINGDGRPDLAFTSHNANFTQVYQQTADRRFDDGHRVDSVGFHPGELRRLPLAGESLYLMSAEGANRLQVYAPAPDGGLTQLSETKLPAPRATTAFHWPDWGLGLAVAPFRGGRLILVKGFDARTGRYTEAMELRVRPRFQVVKAITSADIDADGTPELLFANNFRSDIAVIRAPAAGTQPTIDNLWHSEHGGRAELVVPVDIDQDGDIDLLAPDATEKAGLGRTSINVLLNDGHGQFAMTEIPFPMRPALSGGIAGIVTLDAERDHDGNHYILASGYESTVLIRVPPRWSANAALDYLILPREQTGPIAKALLHDMDGDGWLDAIIGYARDVDSALVLYGPLWGALEQLGATHDTIATLPSDHR